MYVNSRNCPRDAGQAFLLGTAYQPGAHCDHPLCGCVLTHATYKADDGSVGIDPERRIGCGGCIEACPYGARYKASGDRKGGQVRLLPPRHAGAGSGLCAVCPVRRRVFGDADNPDDPVARALAGNRHVYVVPPDFDAKPTLAYLNGTTPTDWPRRKDVPPALAAIGPLSSVVKAFGGLALFGVIGVFVKQLFWPSDSGKPSERRSAMIRRHSPPPFSCIGRGLLAASAVHGVRPAGESAHAAGGGLVELLVDRGVRRAGAAQAARRRGHGVDRPVCRLPARPGAGGGPAVPEGNHRSAHRFRSGVVPEERLVAGARGTAHAPPRARSRTAPARLTTPGRSSWRSSPFCAALGSP
ncbi:MAG: hypothetical protein ACLRWP_06245 [Bilophila wadsworthia]